MKIYGLNEKIYFHYMYGKVVEIPFYVAKPNISGMLYMMSMYTQNLILTIASVIGIILCAGSIAVVRIKDKNFEIEKENAQIIYVICGMFIFAFLICLFIGARTISLLR